MKKEYFTDGSSLKEQVAVLPVGTGGDVQQADVMTLAAVPVFGDSTLPFSGVVYRRWLNKPDCEDNGKSYIGETMDEATRIRSWNNVNSPDYGGSKIKNARADYGVVDWGYEVLEKVYADSKDELKKSLYEREAHYIEKFNSYENGFNGNRGGVGNMGVEFDEARRKQCGDNRRGKPHSDATKQILREKSTGRVKSDDERKKISVGNKGKKRTPEMRQAQSDRMKGAEPKEASMAAKEWREKNGGSYWKGKTLSPESIAKRSVTRRESSQRIRVTDSNGNITDYLCQTDAAKATGLKDGSVNYALNRPDGMHAKSGNKFEKISDAEYQAQKAPRA